MGLSNSSCPRTVPCAMDMAHAARDNSPQSEDESDMTSLFMSLIRSGHVRLITGDNSGMDVSFGSENSEDDSDSGISSAVPLFSSINRRNKTSCPPAKASIDTSVLDTSDIKQSVEISSGVCLRNRESRTKPVLNCVINRESGLLKTTCYSPAYRSNIFNRYLPNAKKEAAKLRSKVFCGQYEQDGRLFISASQDQKVRLYNATMNQFRLKLCVEARDVGWSVLDVAMSPDGRHIAYSSWSDYVHQFSVSDPDDNHVALPMLPGGMRFCIFSLRFSNDGREILGGGSDGALYVYDRDSNQRTLRIANAHEDDVNTVTFGDDSSQIIYSGGDDGVCMVWDRRTLSEESPKAVGALAGHMDGITFIDSKGDARHFISNSKDQTIKLWDIRKFSSSSTVGATKTAVACQHWDYRWQSVPKKALKARRKLDGDTSIMTYRGHMVLHTLVRSRFSPSFSTGQRYIVTGCAASGRVIIYDVLTGQIAKRLEGHYACVRDVSWHPHEMDICSSSWDGTIARWYYDGRDAFGPDSSSREVSDEDETSSEDSDDGEAASIKKRTIRQRKSARPCAGRGCTGLNRAVSGSTTDSAGRRRSSRLARMSAVPNTCPGISDCTLSDKD